MLYAQRSAPSAICHQPIGFLFVEFVQFVAKAFVRAIRGNSFLRAICGKRCNPMTEILHKELSYAIIAAMEVHRILGPGFLEAVYQAALAHELTLRGISFEQYKKLPVRYKGVLVPLRCTSGIFDG